MLNLSSGNDWHRPQPKLTPDHEEQYNALWHVLHKKKLELLRASYQWFKDGYFTHSWRMVRPGEWEKHTGKIRPSFIYDRTVRFDWQTGDYLITPYNTKREIARHVPLYNMPDFTELIDNKLYQATIFSDVMPTTRLWHTGQTVSNPKGEHVVLKHIGGSGGTFVTITTEKKIPVDTTLIQQGFIRAAKKDLRDYRVGIIGEQIQYVYSRIAAKGSLYTNVHQGAHMEFAALKDVQPITRQAKKILARLRPFRKKILSLDFMVDTSNNTPYLVESNSYPGTANFGAARLEKYLTNLVDYLRA